LSATRHTLRLRLVNPAGVLVSAAQVLALLGVHIEELSLRADARGAVLSCLIVADDRTCELACRKLSRLIDVLSLEHQTHHD
jgi:acetolactate synthase small subunit